MLPSSSGLEMTELVQEMAAEADNSQENFADIFRRDNSRNSRTATPASISSGTNHPDRALSSCAERIPTAKVSSGAIPPTQEPKEVQRKKFPRDIAMRLTRKLGPKFLSLVVEERSPGGTYLHSRQGSIENIREPRGWWPRIHLRTHETFRETRRHQSCRNQDRIPIHSIVNENSYDVLHPPHQPHQMLRDLPIPRFHMDRNGADGGCKSHESSTNGRA